MFCIPNTHCKSEWHSHDCEPWTRYIGGCSIARQAILLEMFATTDTTAFFSALADKQGLAAFLYYLPRTWKPVAEATAHAALSNGTGHSASQLSWNDVHCGECDTYVSQSLQPAHWEMVCVACNTHKDENEECMCCDKCGNLKDECECCLTCGESPGWCNCCSHCGNAQGECECEECRDCGDKTWGCSCYSESGHSFGSSLKAPWLKRETVTPLDRTLPRIEENLHNEVDPVMAAADFYLLDAIKNGVRFNSLVGMSDENTVRLMNTKDMIVRSDSMLASVTTAAERSHRNLIAAVLPAFLAYGVAAVGGELRYHRAMSKKDKDTGKAILPGARNKAWSKFTKLVEDKGADVLFDADTLFREFGSSSYGGPLWGNAAKVVGAYLKGDMPAWLFVDRVFTLQHNGGCFLNKVSWARKNKAHWGLSHILYVLNAHAGKDSYGAERPGGETNWALLLHAASPGVKALWEQSERAIGRIGKRFGGSLPRPTRDQNLTYL